jgi:hypothetical protein
VPFPRGFFGSLRAGKRTGESMARCPHRSYVSDVGPRHPPPPRARGSAGSGCSGRRGFSCRLHVYGGTHGPDLPMERLIVGHGNLWPSWSITAP